VLDFSALQEHNHKEIQGEFSVVADLFAELEQKLEGVFKQMEALKRANVELKAVIAQKEEALKEAGATLEKITRDREMVRERIDKILNRLKILDLGEAV
jgi:chromosome segregation ATPase